METNEDVHRPTPSKRRRRIDHVDSKCGVIESISLKNFTCHGSLTIPNLNKNINILIGCNSSGKSSILSAILIGLGGTAAMTNRGSVVRSFIKDGQRVAQVTINLSNVGINDSYQHDVYGDTIIIERKLYADGKSTYVIKSKKGAVVSKTKAELNNILDHFNIQLNNPITLLNQDASRTFLASSNPKQLYKFFLCSTQLYQIKADYMEILECKNETIESIMKRRQQLDGLKAEVMKWENKVKGLASLDDLIKKRDGLFSLAAWAQVAQLEKEHETVINQLEQLARKMSQTETGLQRETEASELAESQHALCESEAKEVERRMDEVESLHQESRATRNKLKTNLRQLKRNIENHVTELKGRESDLADYRRRLEEEKKRDSEEIEAERQDRLAVMAEKEAEIDELELISQDLMEREDRLRDDITRLQETMAANRSVEKEAKANLETLERRLRTLDNGRKDRLKLYGQHVPQIVAEIDQLDRQHRFHRKPKGPIGAFLTVAEPKRWCLAIEQCLRGLLYSFCCHDKHDTDILRNVFHRMIPKGQPVPKILTTKFETERYDVRANLVRCKDHPSLLDLVQIDDPVIYNSIIDQRGVEHILFIQDKTIAKQLLKHSPPVNCREAYTKDGDHIYAGFEQRYYSCAKNEKAKLLRGNIDDVISEFRREIDQQTAALAAMSGKGNELIIQLKEMEMRQTGLRKEKRDISNRMVAVRTALNTLREEEKTESGAVIIEDLEKELSECQDQVSCLRRTLAKLKEQYDGGQIQLKKTEEECQKIDQEMEQLVERVDPIKEKIGEMSLEVETRRLNMEHYTKKKRDLMKRSDHLEEERENRQMKILQAIEKAHQFSEERVECDRTAQSIDSEINEITKRIDKEQRCHGDPHEIRENYERAIETYQIKTRYVDKMESFVKDLDRSMDKRQEHFIDMRKRIAIRTRLEFIGNMSRRGYSAQLVFDHKNENLLIKIDVDNDKRRDAEESSLLLLSGGEKSYSTVCLLMALWYSVESPFLAMDEFDVCMDMVNRRIALDGLMWYGENHRRNQFFFISPLDMSAIQPSPLLTIHQLRPPREQEESQRMDEEEMS